ncbi:MAG: YeeE/YedE family protein [Polyangiaceae bacterium]
MKSLFASLFSGLLFGVGLAIAGMTSPEKVLGFLDFAGSWDASLAFVMAAAIAVHLPLSALIRRRSSPLFDTRFHVPSSRTIDRPLVLGSALFGVGWGLAGVCPGPALVDLATGATPIVVFVGAMVVGMLIQHATVGQSESQHSITIVPQGPNAPVSQDISLADH